MAFHRSPTGLTAQYATIGAALLSVEELRTASPVRMLRRQLRSASRTRSEDASALGTDLAFTPVEVLESYLDDLLDVEVSDEQLFIGRQSRGQRTALLALIGLAASFCVGLLAARAQASLTIIFGVTLGSAFPFALLWQQAPTEGLARRMTFAQILAQEIAHRRGRDDADSLGSIAALVKVHPLRWSRSSTQTAARSIIH